jgi:hypothetical protein
MNMNLQLTDGYNYGLEWQMTNCERYALTSLLERLQPKISLEVGTYRGGSLQVLARHSNRVVSVDIDPSVAERLSGKFANVTFRSGDSTELLPKVVRELNAESDGVGFVLIDGDHSSVGVKRDIEAILKIKPRGRLVIIMHDSFNPSCRAGMLAAAWVDCPYVHFVELDFIPGIYHYEAHDTAKARTMWGGFACAVLEADERVGGLIIGESQRALFEAVHRVSAHAPAPTPGLFYRVLRKIYRYLQFAGK